MPGAKLIVALRNPVDRAYSQFQMRRRTGHEPLEAFADALDVEDPGFAATGGARRADSSGCRRAPDWRTYLSRGRYAEQLERWLRHFPRDQFHFVELDQLAADQLGVLGELHRFLGLPPAGAEQLEARFTAEYDPMPAQVRVRLLEYFRPHNQRLYELLGREFAWDK